MTIQTLTPEQVDNIMNVLTSGIISKKIKTEMDKVMETLKPVIEERKTSDIYTERYAEVINYAQQQEKLFDLYQQMVEIKPELEGDSDFTDCLPTSKEEVDRNIKNKLQYVDSTVEREVKQEFKIREDYTINRLIQEELKARLSMMSFDNYDTIIENITGFIDVNKYLYTSN